MGLLIQVEQSRDDDSNKTHQQSSDPRQRQGYNWGSKSVQEIQTVSQEQDWEQIYLKQINPSLNLQAGA